MSFNLTLPYFPPFANCSASPTIPLLSLPLLSHPILPSLLHVTCPTSPSSTIRLHISLHFLSPTLLPFPYFLSSTHTPSLIPLTITYRFSVLSLHLSILTFLHNSPSLHHSLAWLPLRTFSHQLLSLLPLLNLTALLLLLLPHSCSLQHYYSSSPPHFPLPSPCPTPTLTYPYLQLSQFSSFLPLPSPYCPSKNFLIPHSLYFPSPTLLPFPYFLSSNHTHCTTTPHPHFPLPSPTSPVIYTYLSSSFSFSSPLPRLTASPHISSLITLPPSPPQPYLPSSTSVPFFNLTALLLLPLPWSCSL